MKQSHDLPGGGVVLTGDGVTWFYEISLYYALGLEVLGLRHSRGSAYQTIKTRYGLKGSKAKVREEFRKLLEEKHGRKIDREGKEER